LYLAVTKSATGYIIYIHKAKVSVRLFGYPDFHMVILFDPEP